MGIRGVILAVTNIRKELPMLEYREPTLDELLAEPMIRQVMASDGVDSAEITALMSRMHSRQFRIKRPRLTLDDLMVAEQRSWRTGIADARPKTS
jgi:hypothetical protein